MRKKPPQERRSSSFLVRVWTEPREFEAKERPLRFYVRNLQTGEEQYLASPEQLLQHLTGDVTGGATEATLA